ncbi:MAG: hypothetical protein BWY55_00637 [archaeon ADurb.Bin336]|nr:MAG: hypothetical protein BWY55_00637 [archaeon ADurb.Bin336]
MLVIVTVFVSLLFVCGFTVKFSSVGLIVTTSFSISNSLMNVSYSAFSTFIVSFSPGKDEGISIIATPSAFVVVVNIFVPNLSNNFTTASAISRLFAEFLAFIVRVWNFPEIIFGISFLNSPSFK